MDKFLFFVVFILGIVVGSVFVLTAHNCCCDSHHNDGCCSPSAIEQLRDVRARLDRLERIKVGAAPE
jgi:hypothetical protein